MQQRTRRRPRTDAPAYRSGWLRFALALCASFVAAGYLSAITHMAFVVHARCAEHGELVHVAAAPSDAFHDRRAAATSVTEGTSPTSDEHDHCVLGMAQSAHAGVAEAGHRLVPHEDAPTVAPVVATPHARPLVPPPPPIALLLLSPKSSPPG